MVTAAGDRLNLKSLPAQSAPGAVIISIDGLGARYLGAYGNDWRQTPNLDRWASQGLLLENALTLCPVHWLDCLTRWERPATAAGIPRDHNQPQRVLVTDDPDIAKRAESRFDEVQWVDLPAADSQIGDWTETQAATFFAQAAEVLAEMTAGQVVWIHSAGFQNDWDAPQDWRWDLVGEEDPEPDENLHPPSSDVEINPADLDPDARCRWLQSYGAQLRVIDQCLGMLFEIIEAHWQSGMPLLAIVLGTRGYPLGEHGVVGQKILTAFDESIHVPLLIRDPRIDTTCQRRQSLVDIHDCPEWLNAWMSPAGFNWLDRWPIMPVADEQTLRGQIGDWRLIRTSHWKWMSNNNRQYLFAKPDDRWEQNDVSSRCPEVIVALSESPVVRETGQGE